MANNLTDEDRAALTAILDAPDDRETLRRLNRYWMNDERAERTPREYFYLHLGYVSGVASRLLDTLASLKDFQALQYAGYLGDNVHQAIERDAEHTVALYRRMRVEELRRLRLAHTLDQAENGDKAASVAFGAGRIALIDFVLKEKSDDD